MTKTRNIVKNTLRMLYILFLFLLFVSPNPVLSSSIFTKDCKKANKEYLVKAVFDGDTILLNNNEKIRLLGIDAFEYDQLPYGPKAKEFLTMLTLNKKVCVETDVEEKDIYERTLGYVFLDKKTFVNEAVVKNGLAILYDFPPNIKYIDRLKKAQIYGRQNMLGVWEKQNYIKETPAQWRHEHPRQFKKTIH